MIRALASALAIALPLFASAANEAVTPPEHRRGAEQTFLTFPEWFLVHSPAEYAAFVQDRTPTMFPFIGHVRQFWRSYRSVHEEIRRDYPFNFGYHVMIMVIGVSTAVEYALRSVYETSVGQVSELASGARLSAEDRYGAQVAQDYVDFIRVQPWYEFDYVSRLQGLWTQTGLWGPDLLRKWERKYALTTEYAIKAVYAKLIRAGTKASYEEPLPVTAVVLDRLPESIENDLPELKVLRSFGDGTVLATVPRYHRFQSYASKIASRGANFIEIAGNRSLILTSVLAPAGWQSEPEERVLFTQSILTQPKLQRVAVIVPVSGLARHLNSLQARAARLEHVYDY